GGGRGGSGGGGGGGPRQRREPRWEFWRLISGGPLQPRRPPIPRRPIMATRSRTSFQKRQKEIARMEKQRDKAARRAMRKLNPTGSEESEYVVGEDGLPVLGEDGAPILIDDGSGDDSE